MVRSILSGQKNRAKGAKEGGYMEYIRCIYDVDKTLYCNDYTAKTHTDKGTTITI